MLQELTGVIEAQVRTAPQPLITRFVNSLVYWPLPLWVFTTAYVAVFLSDSRKSGAVARPVRRMSARN